MFFERISHKIIDGWNVRRLTLADALAFCIKHKITITEDENQQHGELVYYRKGDRQYTFILISPFLEPGFRLWVLWHEIAHYILHYPAAAKFSRTCTRKCDREANYVAAKAMMPRNSIQGRTIDQVVHEFGYPRPLVKLRYEIYQNEELSADTPAAKVDESITQILEQYPHLLQRGKDWPVAERKRRKITPGEKAARIAVLMKKFEKPEEPLPF